MSQFKHYAPVSDKQLGFYIDSSRCSGCKACQVACKDKNNLEVGRRFRRVYEVNGGNFIPTGQGGVSNNVFAYTLSISCNHCADPVCTKNCPTTAMHKRPGDGIVRVDTDKCVGCGYCAWSCPYGAPDRCRNAIFAWISRQRGSSQSVWQPVHSKRSNSDPLMNFGRNTARSAM